MLGVPRHRGQNVRKILVVDDNPDSRYLLRAVLERSCDEVLEASQGQEALDIIAEAEPDLVLLDIEMPVMDGYGVLSELRRNPRFASVRVVAISANAMYRDREKALAAGFDAYVTKPIHVTSLRKQVEQLLRS
jgi:two-component system cell cycle response regulator DivK